MWTPGTEALFAGYSVNRVWGERLGAIFLPLPGLLTAAIARSADRPSLTREALAPGASCEAYLLSRRSSRINGDLAIDILLALLVIAGVSVSGALPALGMTNAAFLVFMGTFDYVVYPDIFERRAENEALPVASPTIVSRRCRLRRRVVSRWRNPD